MAYAFTAASSHNITFGDQAEYDNFGVATASIACWSYSASYAQTGGLLCKRDAYLTSAAISLYIVNPGVAWCDFSDCLYYSNGAAPTNSAWNHHAATYNGAAGVGARVIYYMNGVAQSMGVNNEATNNIGNSTAGLRFGQINETGPAYFEGRLCEGALWNVTLDAAEVAALAKGFSPQMVRPSALKFYAPLVNEALDRRNSYAGTVTGASVIAHPRMIYPAKSKIGFPAAAAAAAYTPRLTLLGVG